MLYQNNIKIPNDIQSLQAAALLAAVLLVGSNAFVLSPMLSEVAQGLKADASRIAWSISAFGVGTAISALTLAGLIDRLPVARVLAGAALLLALAQILSGVSQNWYWLCLSQALAGVATGILLPGTYATATATAPRGRESARLGLVLTGWSLSLVCAVPLTTWIAEHFGWRAVYALLAGLSVFIALLLMLALRGLHGSATVRTPPLRAMRLQGVALRLLVVLLYMTAFYGSFAFFGLGLRAAFDLSAQGTGVFVFAYGLGFGLAGITVGRLTPRITRRYVMFVLFGGGLSYLSWHYTLASREVAFLGAVAWGIINQLGLNALVVSLSERSSTARGAVMGLNSAVTYLGVFAGPIIMGPVYVNLGFAAVGALAAMLVIIGAFIFRWTEDMTS